ncbi:MAG: LamG-like jellyroll fold domain-containing protein, partial [Planctomycetota bacterium]
MSLTPTLRWASGVIEGYTSPHEHDIYLGTDFNDVNNATLSDPEFRNTQDYEYETWEPNSEGGLTLVIDTDYYWRIDESHGRSFLPGVQIKGDVWTFRTRPDFPITDPNLIGRWTLDEGGGDRAFDWSGHNNHGTINGNPEWVSGMLGNALDFNGGDYIELPTGMVDSNNGTVSVWIKTTQSSRGHIFYGGVDTDDNGYGGADELHLNVENGGGIDFWITGGVEIGTAPVNNDDWHHIAATWEKLGEARLYVNGGTPLTTAHTANSFDLTGCIRLGRPGDPERYYLGVMDDVQLYDYALSQAEIIRAASPLEAWAPSPASGIDVRPEDLSGLSWRSGAYADKHTVYFGTSLDDVNESATAVSVKQDATSYDPGPLAYDTYYYWRIDEVNDTHGGSPWTGHIWTFYLMRPNRGVMGRYYHWIDPTVVATGDPGPSNPFQTFRLERIDPEIDFEWGNGSPDPNVNDNDFSVQWVGEVEAEFTETYTFTVRTDDGVRLWINDQLLVDQWINQGATRVSGTIDLVAGDSYPLVMEYYERGGGAVAQLFWESPSLPEEIVPQRLLSLALRATNPRPHNRQEVSADEVTLLSWQPGIKAVTHDVYFGTSISDVNASATAVSTGQPYDVNF